MNVEWTEAVLGRLDMVIILDLELEAALSQQARQQGVDTETLVVAALRDRFLHPALRDASRDEWEQLLIEVASDCGVSLPNSALIAESFYE
jgi:hypothetical protein